MNASSSRSWTVSLGLCLLLAAACQAAKSGPPANGFDRDAAGQLPAGWRIGTTGAVGKPASWAVRADAGAASPPNCVALAAIDHDSQDAFNLCWTDQVLFKEGRLGVAVRADGGKVDQGGGLAWRVKDADNYYICRYNPLESNFRVYVVTGGVRRQLATATVRGEGKGWHQVAVEHRGDHIVCWLDGDKLLEANDSTLLAGGGVGFWTKADARTSFDDFVVEPATN